METLLKVVGASLRCIRSASQDRESPKSEFFCQSGNDDDMMAICWQTMKMVTTIMMMGDIRLVIKSLHLQWQRELPLIALESILLSFSVASASPICGIILCYLSFVFQNKMWFHLGGQFGRNVSLELSFQVWFVAEMERAMI